MQARCMSFQPAFTGCRPRSRVGAALPSSCSLRTGPQAWAPAPRPLFGNGRPAIGSRPLVAAQAAEEGKGGDKQVKYNKEFGYSRKDVILIGVGITALGYGAYYGLQATGMEPGMAGNFVQLFIILGMSVGWVGSYLWRVATKNMTYVKQLEEYEEAVMAKRLEEMPEAEVERMLGEVEDEKRRREERRAAAGGKQ